MENRLIDSGRKYGMEIIHKSQAIRVSRNNESLHIKVNNRELKEFDHLNNLEVCQQNMVTAKRKSRRELPLSKRDLTEKYHS